MKNDNGVGIIQDELTDLLREGLFKYLMGQPMLVMNVRRAHKTPYSLPDKPTDVNIIWSKENEK